MRIMGGEAKLLATRVQGRTRHGPCQLERPPTYRARAPAWSSDAKEKQQKRLLLGSSGPNLERRAAPKRTPKATCAAVA